MVWHAGVYPYTQNIVEKVLEIVVHFCNHSTGTSSLLAFQSSLTQKLQVQLTLSKQGGEQLRKTSAINLWPLHTVHKHKLLKYFKTISIHLKYFGSFSHVFGKQQSLVRVSVAVKGS